MPEAKLLLMISLTKEAVALQTSLKKQGGTGSVGQEEGFSLLTIPASSDNDTGSKQLKTAEH